MKVSVIYPTYKRADICINPLNSLLNQDFPKKDFEVIIVDNNSPDNTEAVVKKWLDEHRGQMNVRYIKAMQQGDGFARNSGAVVAKGEYLLFADDDSLFDTNWVSCLTKLLDDYPTVAMAGSRIVIQWDEEPDKWIKNYESYLGACKHNESGYIINYPGFCIANGSLAIRREIFLTVGGNEPGQVGEWLVGNAEVGLFHKVRNLGYPIAFTDDTTMWHQQRKAKNGTYDDIARRIMNCAISDAYGDVVEQGKIQYRSLRKDRLQILKCILRLKRAKLRRAIFDYMADKKYNEWVDRYQSEEYQQILALRKSIRTSDILPPSILFACDYTHKYSKST